MSTTLLDIPDCTCVNGQKTHPASGHTLDCPRHAIISVWSDLRVNQPVADTPEERQTFSDMDTYTVRCPDGASFKIAADSFSVLDGILYLWYSDNDDSTGIFLVSSFSVGAWLSIIDNENIVREKPE